MATVFRSFIALVAYYIHLTSDKCRTEALGSIIKMM